MEAPYPVGYFEIQVAFAQRMAYLLDVPLEETLLSLTSLYKLLGSPGAFDLESDVWRQALTCVDARADIAEQASAIHRYYLTRYPLIPKFGDERHWGCFAYEWRADQRALRLHFANEDASAPGALSQQRLAARQAELRAMLRVAREERPDAEWIVGGSWLYNLETYRRLFPPAFTATATPDEPHIQFRALWGQFLRRNGSLNRERANAFLARVAALDDAAQYAGCFPFQVLLTHAPVDEFFRFYGV